VVESWPARLVGQRTAGMVGFAYAVRTAGNAGSEPLIFVPRAAHSHDLSNLMMRRYAGMAAGFSLMLMTEHE
jgi:hypothetical protein